MLPNFYQELKKAFQVISWIWEAPKPFFRAYPDSLKPRGLRRLRK